MGCNQEDYLGAKSSKGSFPKRMIIDCQEIFDLGKIANCFNKLFVFVASMIPESQTKFGQYLNPHQTLLHRLEIYFQSFVTTENIS